MGMKISEDYHGVQEEEDPILKFKPWPIGGTTNSLSLRSAMHMGADPDADRGDVNVRRRRGGELSAEGKKRQKVQNERRREVARNLRAAEGNNGVEGGAMETGGGGN
jgi:hypothetical protein